MSKTLKTCIAACCYVLLWHIAALCVANELYLPGPVAVAGRLFALAGSAAFWQSVGMTLLRVLCGFLLGMLAGGLLGALCALSKTAAWLLAPLCGVIRATPVVSVILLILLWVSRSMAPLLIALLMVLPVAWTNVQTGLESVDPALREMLDVFAVRGAKRVRALYLPALRPPLSAALRTGMGFAWKSGVAAEVLAAPALSIGRGLYESKLYLEIPDLFAWTITTILLSLLLEKLALRLLGGKGDRR